MFSIGARVLVDGRDEAIVKQAFPQGSSSFLFPHYKVDFVGGDRNVAVAMPRVGVDRKGTGIHGWPLVPSKAFPGETTLACPACGSTDVTHGVKPGFLGTGPGGRWRMGDSGGGSFIRCNDCNNEDTRYDGSEKSHA